MNRFLMILACLLASPLAAAQTAGTTPGSLDLSVPQAPLRYLNDGMLDVMVRGKGVGAIVVPMAVT